jgi:Peptidase propeptide and YPEB domain
MKKTGVITVAALAMLALVSQSPVIGGAQAAQMTNNCDPSDHIDGSTAAMAKQKFEAAGYSQLHDFAKGCDNYWHAQGMKNGNPVNVVLSPQGDVMTEGD